MTSEQFWKQATEDRPVMKGLDHLYFIDNGYKVEMYTNGKMVLYNTKCGGFFYKEVKDANEILRFLVDGFDKASLELTIRELQDYCDSHQNNRAKMYQEMIKKYKKKYDKIQNK